MRKCRGRGRAWTRVRWQTPEGRWTAESRDVILYAPSATDKWGEMIGVVRVPKGAGRLLILLSVLGQQSEEDAAWFDDVGLYKLP
jgi:hypothetical protein